jgi:hypothetical protein
MSFLADLLRERRAYDKSGGRVPEGCVFTGAGPLRGAPQRFFHPCPLQNNMHFRV